MIHLPPRRLLILFMLFSWYLYGIIIIEKLAIPTKGGLLTFTKIESKQNSSNSKSRFPKRPQRTTRTLYACGWGAGLVPQRLFDDLLNITTDGLFPENETAVALPTFDPSNNSATAEDILVFGGGDCGPAFDLHWLQEHFQGKIIYINGESYAGADYTGPNSFMISCQETTQRNIQVPYAAMALVGAMNPTVWTIITEKSYPRPRNTADYFMAYATRNCVAYRNEVALALSQIGVIHHGDCYPKDATNFTPIANVSYGSSNWPTNYQLFSQFRFCLVLENGSHPGYVTEKILNAFFGGCLPIWYGTTDVWNIFHRNSFLYVDVTRPESIEELVQKVRYLESNASAYDEYFQSPILADDPDSVLEKYFSLDDSIGKGRLKHDIRVMLGLEDKQ